MRSLLLLRYNPCNWWRSLNTSDVNESMLLLGRDSISKFVNPLKTSSSMTFSLLLFRYNSCNWWRSLNTSCGNDSMSLFDRYNVSNFVNPLKTSSSMTLVCSCTDTILVIDEDLWIHLTVMIQCCYLIEIVFLNLSIRWKHRLQYS